MTINVQPVGQVCFFALYTPPPGWLKCNGAYISQSTYSGLYAVVGSTYGVTASQFGLPDLRSRFIRHWDDGRNLDKSGRSFAQDVGDGMPNHDHGISTYGDYNGWLNAVSPGIPFPNVVTQSYFWNGSGGTAGGSKYTTFILQTSFQALWTTAVSGRTGADSFSVKPSNSIVLNAFIKY